MKNLEKKIFKLHDKGVNQTYGGKLKLPYSFHVKMVLIQCNRFRKLLTINEQITAHGGCLLHDTIEDCRLTYNDIVMLLKEYGLEEYGKDIAEVVYLVTDFKGRNRAERKPQQYYEELRANEVALFVKLCDMIANKYFSAMTNSSMLKAYEKEFPKFKELTFNERFKEMYDHLENIN